MPLCAITNHAMFYRLRVKASPLHPETGWLMAVKGTSYASGFVSGYAARLLADRPDLSPEELTQHILAGIDTVGGCLPTEME